MAEHTLSLAMLPAEKANDGFENDIQIRRSSPVAEEADDKAKTRKRNQDRRGPKENASDGVWFLHHLLGVFFFIRGFCIPVFLEPERIVCIEP